MPRLVAVPSSGDLLLEVMSEADARKGAPTSIGPPRIIGGCESARSAGLGGAADFETGLISIRHPVAYAKGMGSFIKDTKTHDARGIPSTRVGLLFLKN